MKHRLTPVLQILLVCSMIAGNISFANAQQESSGCNNIPRSIDECTKTIQHDYKGLSPLKNNHGLYINLIYRPLPPAPKWAVFCRIKKQIKEQRCICTSKKTQTDVEVSADTVFMRYRNLLPETISPKVLNQFAAASVSQDIDSKISLLESLIQESNGVIKYRAYIQLAMAVLRSRAKNYQVRLPQYLQAMETIDLSAHPQAELLKSDLSFIRAYLAFERGDIEKGLQQINRAIVQDPQMLNARLLHTALLVRQFDSMYRAGIRNSRQCHNRIDELFHSTGNIVDLMPCPHQAIAFALELDGWTKKQNRVSTLITHAYLYKIARQDTYLSKLIEQNIPEKLDRLPSACGNYLLAILNEIKKVKP